MSPGRPIGSHVRQAAEIVERLGPATYGEVHPWMPEVPDRKNVHKYLCRAVEYGLMTCHGQPKKFEVVDNWRSGLRARQVEIKVSGGHPVASVWELGTRATP